MAHQGLGVCLSLMSHSNPYAHVFDPLQWLPGIVSRQSVVDLAPQEKRHAGEDNAMGWVRRLLYLRHLMIQSSSPFRSTK